MNRVLELTQQKAALYDEAGVILQKAQSENRALTAEEQAAFDTKASAMETITKSLAAEERFAAMGNAFNDGKQKLPAAGGRAQVHDNAGDRPFTNLGEQMISVVNATNGRSTDPRLLQLRAPSGMSEAVPSDGGFLVQPDFASEIFKRSYETGQLASRCKKVPLSEATNALKINGIDETSRVDGSRHGGVQSYWANEADALTASKPKFRQIELVLKKLTALYYTTDELMKDATALGSIATDVFGEEFGFKLDNAIYRGTGAGQPFGILTAPATVSVAKEAGQASATLVVQNVVKMWARMYGRSRQNAVWFYNQDMEPQLGTLSLAVGTGGAPVFMPANNLSGSPYSTLYGRPMVPIEQCETLGTVGDIMLADLSQYYIIDRGGIDTAMSMHVRFVNDELVFRFIMRVDGQPIWQSALTPFKGSNTQSPFVTLASR